MRIPDIHPPDPNDPKGMAWIFAAGVCDPRPGGYPDKGLPNQQWALKQTWEPTSKMFWDLGLRYHPELATKWLSGGGQFSVAEVVDSPPDEPDDEELMREMAEEQFAAMTREIEHIKEHGTDYQKKRMLQRYRMAMKQSQQMAAMIQDAIKDIPDEQNLDKKGE
jgi:ribosomal protein S15P/S13E